MFECVLGRACMCVFAPSASSRALMHRSHSLHFLLHAAMHPTAPAERIPCTRLIYTSCIHSHTQLMSTCTLPCNTQLPLPEWHQGPTTPGCESEAKIVCDHGRCVPTLCGPCMYIAAHHQGFFKGQCLLGWRVILYVSVIHLPHLWGMRGLLS